MAIVSFPASYHTSPEVLVKLLDKSSLDGKGKNEVDWSFDAIQIWQEWFAARYGELKELRHRSNPDDPPDLDLVFERGQVGLEHTALKPDPLGYAEAIAGKVNPMGGRFIPSLSRQWTRDELKRFALGIKASWAKTSEEHRVAFECLIEALRRKMQNPTSRIICVRDEATLELTLKPIRSERLAKDLWQVVNTDEFEDFADRTVILFHRDNELQFFSALVRRREPLQMNTDGVPMSLV